MLVTSRHRCGVRGGGAPPARAARRGYRTFASSAANALRGACSRSRPPRFLRSGLTDASDIGRCYRLRSTAFLALRGLRRIGSQQTIFQRRTIETANDRGHFVGGWRFDKCEALRFLRFVIADHLYGVGHEIFGGQPLFDVIGGDPCGEIAKKYGKAHSVDFLTPWLDLRHFKGRIPICHIDSIRQPQRIANTNGSTGVRHRNGETLPSQ